MYKCENVLSLSLSPAELGYLPWDNREGPCAGPVSSLCALIMAPSTERAYSHPSPYALDCNVHISELHAYRKIK